jgi:hypothetical protein
MTDPGSSCIPRQREEAARHRQRTGTNTADSVACGTWHKPPSRKQHQRLNKRRGGRRRHHKISLQREHPRGGSNGSDKLKPFYVVLQLIV